MYVNIQIGIIHHSQTRQSKYLLTGKCLNKLCYILIMKYYSVVKKKMTNIHSNIESSLKRHAKWKKPVTKDAVLYDDTYVKFPENTKLVKKSAVDWESGLTTKGYEGTL